MNHGPDVDLDVNSVVPHAVVEPDDARVELFFDRTTGSGIRLLAVAEPVNRNQHGYLTASVALAAFEEAVTVTIKDGVEPGLYRAFAAANDAVRSANRRTMSSLRAYAGITAVVIEGSQATIGYVPPGQTLILQDGRIYGVPDLATWEPGFMPWSDSEEPEPLGFSAVPRPRFRKTTVGTGDQVMLGESAVGRVLANQGLEPLSDLTEQEVLGRVEQGLAASGIDNAYAAWIRFDKVAPCAEIDESRMAQLDQLWRSTGPAAASCVDHADPRLRRVARREAWRDRLIDVSERLLSQRETEPLPMESRSRAAAPVAPTSLHRYVAPHHPSLNPWFRAWLPRGLRMPHSRRSLAALLAVLLLVSAAAVTHNVRDTRAAKQDRYLGVAKTEIQLAQSASSKEKALPHIQIASDSLDEALENGADSALIDDWRVDLTAVEDRWNGVSRLTHIKRIGAFPGPLSGEDPELILAGGNLFLIADGVYLVGENDHRLMPMLAPGEEIDGEAVGGIISAAVDGDDLVVTDGRSLFRLDDRMTWSGARLASSRQPGGWSALSSGTYKGSYYLFDLTEKQINKFDGGNLEEQPVAWLTEKAAKHATHVVDMVVDSDIYLLTTDGSVYSFSRGKDKDKYEIPDAAEGAKMIGLHGGSGMGYVYVVEIDNRAGELIRFDPENHERVLYLAPLAAGESASAEGARAFGRTTDFAIDEAAGVIYFVTSDGLWRASFN